MKKTFSMTLLLSFLVTAAVFLTFIGAQTAFSQDNNISIDVENAPIETVLKLISSQSGLNIVTSQNVSGSITVNINNVSVEKALDAVLRTNNYMYSIEGNIIRVFSYGDMQQEERFAGLVTRVFTLEYTDVTDLRRALLSMKTVRGRIELNPKGNQVIVTDTPEKVKEIEKALELLDQKVILKKYKLKFGKASDLLQRLTNVIPEEKGQVFIDERTNSIVVRATSVVLRDMDELVEGWDVQHRQVLIEARLIQVTMDKNFSLGIDWQYQNEGYSTSSLHRKLGEPEDLSLAGDLSVGLTQGGLFNIGTLTADEYSVVLEALETNVNAETLSAPRICVLDNEEANILVGSSEPYLVTAQDPDTGFITEQTEFIDVGIKLLVTPQIGENDYVTMTVHPEVSSARRVAEVDNALAVDTTQADTTMMVKDGETIVLGGLIKSAKQETLKKIPFLGDIPILGLLFRSKEDEDVRQELIVFITPHILTDTNRQDISCNQWGTFKERTGTEEHIIGLSEEGLPKFEQESF